MSEAERKRRLDYKRNRKKWLFVQLISIALALIIAVGAFVAYSQLNRAYYIEYREGGSVDYRVNLKDNTYYTEEWLPKDREYVAELIDDVLADFQYEMEVDADDVKFDYSYEIYAQILVKGDSGAVIYDPIYVLKPETTFTQTGSRTLNINEQVSVDYHTYNEKAAAFIDGNSIEKVKTTLVVTMKVNVISKCDDFEENGNNSYSLSLNLPLVSNTISIYTSSAVPTAESKILACVGKINQNIFLVLGIVASLLAALGVCGVFIYAYKTRNEDINYEIKIKRLLSRYRSFIQKINNEFDKKGYQILMIGSFTEMLSIRDTIQSPILMSENADKTKSEFIIVTDTDLIYMFEVKVDDYDRIYGNKENI